MNRLWGERFFVSVRSLFGGGVAKALPAEGVERWSRLATLTRSCEDKKRHEPARRLFEEPFHNTRPGRFPAEEMAGGAIWEGEGIKLRD
jgi:hypothetical protein